MQYIELFIPVMMGGWATVKELHRHDDCRVNVWLRSASFLQDEWWKMDERENGFNLLKENFINTDHLEMFLGGYCFHSEMFDN